MRTDRVPFLGVRFDELGFEEVLSQFAGTRCGDPYKYLVTPNVDHVVRLDREPDFRPLYEEADFCVCDSRVLRLLGRAAGLKLPVVAGSDLTAALFDRVIKEGDRIAVVGSDAEIIEHLRLKLPKTEFLHFEPPMGLRNDPEARAAAAKFIGSSKARFTFVAVGSPQQEMIAAEVRQLGAATGVALCIGAGLDFIAGKQKRAPAFVQRLNLEWAHRLVTNPRRLWRRYLVDGSLVLPMFLRWYLRERPARSALIAVLVLLAVAAGIFFFAAHTHARSRTMSSFEAAPSPENSVAAIKALPPPDLVRKLSPEDATKENLERPFAERDDSAAKPFTLRAATENDKTRATTCLAQAIYYEAAGEGVAGGRAVAQVVLNRVRHPGFPASVCGVVYEGSERASGCQFSFTCDGSMQRDPSPTIWKRSLRIAEEALSGNVFAPVGHATHYHADYVLPYWADSLDKSAQVGRHIFYRLRGALGVANAFSQRYVGVEPPVSLARSHTVVLTGSPTDQLVNILVNEDSRDPLPTVEKPASAQSPLLVDSEHGSLITDSPSGGSASHQAKPNCPKGIPGESNSSLKADHIGTSGPSFAGGRLSGCPAAER